MAEVESLYIFHKFEIYYILLLLLALDPGTRNNFGTLGDFFFKLVENL